MKKVYYGEDFIILPKYAYRALSKFYVVNLELQRKVVRHVSGRPQEVSDDKVTSEVHQFFIKRAGNVTLELEISPVLLYCGWVTPEGERPYKKAIVNESVDWKYVKEVLQMDTLPFKEVALSKTANFNDFFESASQT
mmetsp:Transcript_11751/g.18015  ORF Transcript_11751/g.18015 Transcript_11751/m.18015 type:complete len:137 (+) Transcript_11751:542-952(+)